MPFSVTASPAAHTYTSPGSHSMDRTARSSRSVLPAGAPSRVSQVIVASASVGSSWRWLSSPTSMKTRALVPAGISASHRPIAGSAVSSPITSSQSAPSGWPCDILGPAIQVTSPGFTACAHDEATPPSCRTKSKSISPASGSYRTGV